MSFNLASVRSLRLLAVALLLTVLVPACSVNPATGKQQLNLIPESQEIAMGQEADVGIVAQMGLYPDEGLQAYVQELGSRLAAKSERPHLPWTFRVLDDPLVNAFALPGGYVYVTRGIMAHLESEAELVGILGHEIGHVTARHGVNQLSKQQLAGIGLAVGTIASPTFARYGDLAQTGMGLLFLKYSRDDEKQSDALGLRYALRTNYDPREIPGVFGLLQRVGQASGGGRAPEWMATHPDPGRRQETMNAEVAKLNMDFGGATVNARSYQQRLDGMVFGANPREGYFEDDRFLHPDLAFSLEFPAGWQKQNQRQAVVAVSEAQDAMVQMTLANDAAQPAAAAREFISQEGLKGGQVETGRVGGFAAASALFEVEREGQDSIVGRVTFVRYNDRTYQLLGFTLQEKWGGYRKSLEGSLNSFRRVTDRKVLDAQPSRLSLVDLERPMPLEEFQRRYPSTVPIQTLGLINRLDGQGNVIVDPFAKRVVGGPGG
jgi:predicted Zn-dependent protease